MNNEKAIILAMKDLPRYIDGGSRVSPLIAAREIIVNSIEADATHIEVNAICINGIPKVYIRDNGTGMTAKEMRSNLCCLGVSGNTRNKSHSGNFGQGGRISTLGRNHEGILYNSTYGGITTSVLVYYDTKLEDYVATTPVSKKAKKGVLDGTEIIFMGNSADEDTSLQFGGQQEILSFLRNRFFNLKQPTTISLFGRVYTLDGIQTAIAASSQCVIPAGVPGIEANYYLLKEASSLAGIYVIFRDLNKMGEIYERRPASELTKYGIDAAAHSVVLTITLDSANTYPQLDRTTLVHEGKSLSELLNNDSVWPDTFKKALPTNVKRFEQAERRRQLCSKPETISKLLETYFKLYPSLRFNLLNAGDKPRRNPTPNPTPNPDPTPNPNPPVKKPRPMVKAGKSRGFCMPEIRENSGMGHVVEYNPETFSLSFNFDHDVAKRAEDQFIRVLPSGQKNKGIAAHRNAQKVLAVEYVYTVSDSHLGAGALTPAAITASILLRSRAQELARKLMRTNL